MRVVVQRVRQARVEVAGAVVGAIGAGLYFSGILSSDKKDDKEETTAEETAASLKSMENKTN